MLENVFCLEFGDREMRPSKDDTPQILYAVKLYAHISHLGKLVCRPRIAQSNEWTATAAL